MKKVILILLLLIFTTACYDYKEIDDLALISGIALEKENQNYILTYEILDTNSSNEENTPSSMIVSANGKSIVNAFENISLSLSKIPYFYHLKIFIIDENIAKNDLFDLVDYLSRNTSIRNEFYLLLAQNVKPSDLLNKNENNKVVSNSIENLVKNNKYFYSVSTIKPFENFFEDIVNNKYTAILSTLTKENEKIKLSGLAFFNDYKLITTLKDKPSALFNVLNNNKPSILYTVDYKDGYISSSIYKSDVKIKFKDNKTILNINLEGNIKENTTDKDLIKPEVLKSINDDFQNLLKKKITSLVNEFNKYDIDPLKIRDSYYKKYRKTLDKINYEIKITFKNNKKGLTFTIK